MNNILIYSDLHRNQSSLKECELIDNELISFKEKYNCDTIISLGDNFDSIKPSSQELDSFAKFIKRLNCKFIVIAADSHESTTQEESILNHYGILSNNVKIIKEYKDQNHLFCGHFVIKESNKNYGAKLSKQDLKNYLYVFLGHQHSYEMIKPNICHLGSCRWVNFDEAKDKYKIIALISDYGTDKENVHFMKLKSPIPMIQLGLGKNHQKEDIANDLLTKKVPQKSQESGFLGYFKGVADLILYLDKIDPRTKVKVKILDFESFREFLPLVDRYNSKFEVFKYETNFEIISESNKKEGLTEMTSFKESFANYLKNQKINEQIKKILEEEIK